MKRLFSVLLATFAGFAAVAVENVNFYSKPLTAGKASLTENGFIVDRLLGVANFSPELRFPIQLIYNSASEKSGIFGFGWHSPQLESSACYDKDGVLWTTPWGEQIKFFAKDTEVSKDAIKVELLEEARKGRGFYAPYSDWEADTNTSAGKLAQSGDWIFIGKRQYRGWRFIYRDARLRSISAPSGRSLTFLYKGDQLNRIEQSDVAFVELAYEGDQVVSATINGVESHFKYINGEVIVLPKTTSGEIIRAWRPRLASIQTGKLNPVEFAYRDSYLSRIHQGTLVDTLTVQTETVAERVANLRSLDRKSGVKHSGKVAGRLLADSQYKYTYSGSEPGKVTLTNRLNQTAGYDYNQQTGVFKLCDFSGKTNTVYYFMRYDVAYLGKVRKIVDGRGRDVVNYRYDKLTGNVIRIRDMAGNDINFSYDRFGNLTLISRRAAGQNDPEPTTGLRYDEAGNPVMISMLDASGKAVQTTAIQYNRSRQPVTITNGQNKNSVVYNNFGYPTEVRDVFGRKQQFRFDKFNRLVSQVDSFGVTTDYHYTAAGQISGIERRDGNELLSSLAVSYNDNGQPVSYTDHAGRSKKFERDVFGRVVKEFFPDQTSVEYSYNALGQLDTVLDQNRNEIKFDWNKFGLGAKTTAEGQLTDYVHDEYGMLAEVNSVWHDQTDRSIQYEYDKFDRLVKTTYGNGETETFAYDSWGRVIAAGRGDKKATFKYDYFGRMIEKNENGVVTTYTYNPWGQRTGRVTRDGDLTLAETRNYDQYGRLTEIQSGGKTVKYSYNDLNQLALQVIDNIPIEFGYTKYGQLESKIFGGRISPISSLKYVYSRDGQILGRDVNGEFLSYTYDAKGQLLTVTNPQGNIIEAYSYDPVGNILSKTIDGKTTTYTYDKANQLVSSAVDGEVTDYAYDAAGRLVKEGDKVYTYGWLDKILNVTENGRQTAAFAYHVDGQLANSVAGGKSETFLWDGLALIKRGTESFINEPAITGGNPVFGTESGVMFNDMLGTTLGIKGESFTKTSLTAFGESLDKDNRAFFTGKPHIGELGYAFLFRNYRADMGKWQTADPLGYPDGWNNFAYVNNGVTMAIDWLGGELIGSGSFNAYSLFTGNFVPPAGGPNFQLLGGNPIVSYNVEGTFEKTDKGITFKGANISYNAQGFGILYYNDVNGNGYYDSQDVPRISMYRIAGSAMIGSSSSMQTSKKNEDGSTTYTVTVNISVTEKVSGSYGTFTQIKNLAPYTITHTVTE